MTEGREHLKAWMAGQEPRSQRAWAERLGVAQSYLSQILTGARQPGRATIEQIERATAGAVSAAAWFQSASCAGGADSPSGRRASSENHPQRESGPPFAA